MLTCNLAPFPSYRGVLVNFSLSTELYLSFTVNPWTHEHKIWRKKTRDIALL